MSKILIVEDDAGFASSLAEAVRDFGYEVTIAPSGEDALARFDEIGAALVFSICACAECTDLKCSARLNRIPIAHPRRS